jgi:hypothetical protein
MEFVKPLTAAEDKIFLISRLQEIMYSTVTPRRLMALSSLTKGLSVAN